MLHGLPILPCTRHLQHVGSGGQSQPLQTFAAVVCYKSYHNPLLQFMPHLPAPATCYVYPLQPPACSRHLLDPTAELLCSCPALVGCPAPLC